MKKACFENNPRVGPGNGESHSTASTVLSPSVYVGDKNSLDGRGPESTSVPMARDIVCMPAPGSSADMQTMSGEHEGDVRRSESVVVACERAMSVEGEGRFFAEPRSLAQGRAPSRRRRNRGETQSPDARKAVGNAELAVSLVRVDSDRFWELGSKRQRRADSQSETDSLRSNSPIQDASGAVRRREFLLERREKRETEAEKLIEDQLLKAGEERAALGLVVEGEADACTTKALNERILDDIAIIVNVATKSRNIKGTFVRALKESAASIKSSLEALRVRSTTDETVKLREDNASLKAEVAELRKEIAELKKLMPGRTQGSPASRQPMTERMEVQEPAPYGAVPGEELTRSIMLQVGNMMNARLEAYEERLLPEKRLRPPLAADRVAPSVLNRQPKPTQAPAGRNANDAVPRPLPPQGTEEGWTTVGKRGARRKKGAQSTSGAKSAAPGLPSRPVEHKKRKPKQRSPRSAAIVITLQPQAENSGMTYAKVLEKARQNISLADCGISGLRCRSTVTGARILEVPGAESGDKADSFAQKLRESLGDEVRVTRPTICTELRIVGLDDSVTAKEVASEIARQGCCPLESVKVGQIKAGARGSGAVWAKCPVIAAKKLLAGGRLLVGWVSASVRLLEPRPMRCFRCLEVGHVRVHCTSEVDRSDECYRCGRPGHKAFDCSAVPKCSLCAAAGRPAEHRSGDKACTQPRSKKMAKAAARQAAAKSSVPPQTGAEEAMNTN